LPIDAPQSPPAWFHPVSQRKILHSFTENHCILAFVGHAKPVLFRSASFCVNQQ
jgi:hypothetical protein